VPYPLIWIRFGSPFLARRHNGVFDSFELQHLPKAALIQRCFSFTHPHR
jgi:hypothetical protein